MIFIKRNEKSGWNKPNILAKMGKDELVSVESLAKICIALNCSVDDILEFILEENEHEC